MLKVNYQRKYKLDYYNGVKVIFWQPRLKIDKRTRWFELTIEHNYCISFFTDTISMIFNRSFITFRETTCKSP